MRLLLLVFFTSRRVCVLNQRTWRRVDSTLFQVCSSLEGTGDFQKREREREKKAEPGEPGASKNRKEMRVNLYRFMLRFASFAGLSGLSGWPENLQAFCLPEKLKSILAGSGRAAPVDPENSPFRMNGIRLENSALLAARNKNRKKCRPNE